MQVCFLYCIYSPNSQFVHTLSHWRCMQSASARSWSLVERRPEDCSSQSAQLLLQQSLKLSPQVLHKDVTAIVSPCTNRLTQSTFSRTFMTLNIKLNVFLWLSSFFSLIITAVIMQCQCSTQNLSKSNVYWKTAKFPVLPVLEAFELWIWKRMMKIS